MCYQTVLISTLSDCGVVVVVVRRLLLLLSLYCQCRVTVLVLSVGAVSGSVGVIFKHVDVVTAASFGPSSKSRI